MSALQNAGLYNAEVRINDGTDIDSVGFEAWFAANRREVRIQQDDDPEDGFDSVRKLQKIIKFIIYLDDAMGKTQYLFIEIL